MRKAILLIGIATLAGASSPGVPPRTPEAQAKLDKHLSGRVAGEPVNCIKSSQTISPIGIDDHTMLFRDGPRIWRTELQGAFQCADLGGRKSVVTGGNSIRVCRGDRVHIVDLTDGSPVGSCVMGAFVPYAKP